MKSEAGMELLRSVSRSFYLTIALLSPDLRAPIGTAYLLARASDTIADTASVAASQRIKHLESFRAAVMGGDRAPLSEIRRDIVPCDRSELRLMERIGECLQVLERQPAQDREQIRTVVGTITSGQMFDIKRFGGADTVCSLETAEELYNYTWMVAGCVGKFWTHVCLNHNPGYSRIPIERLVQLGVNFGKGLQLVNILRDAPVDLRAGRCYLPAVQLKAAGTTPAELVEHPEKARPIADRWRRIAVRHLGDAACYIMAIRPMRLRFACFLPWYLGLRTLALLEETPSLETKMKVKVGRNEVRAALVFGPLAVCSNSILQRLHDAFSRNS
jgi:farnesyl-diphosphate farnesyltransferase